MGISTNTLAEALMWAMQLSIFLPLAKFWRNRTGLPRPLRLLGWYFPLSVVTVAVARVLTAHQMTNLLPLTAFNVSKTLLFGLVLRQVLPDRWTQGISDALLVLGVATVGAALVWLPLITTVTVARLGQCVVLTVIALAYLEQASRQPTARFSTDPYFWLCVGQLGYAAATVAVFGAVNSLYYAGWRSVAPTVMALAGLYQNYTLWQVYAHAPGLREQPAQLRLP